MFQWYAEAAVCYVYLYDLEHDCPHLSDDIVKSGPWFERLRRCAWFTRGWTLQELLAPQLLYFHSCHWARIANLTDLLSTISKITRIDEDVLSHRVHVCSVSIAERMSWASHRKTTRVEDTAYSLLGIFEVNMSMLYGERERAFKRLQEQIIKNSSDQSIFAWEDNRRPPFEVLNSLQPPGQILAPSPSHFFHCAAASRKYWNGASFELTNAGLRLNCYLVNRKSIGSNEFVFAVLDCYNGRMGRPVALMLR